MIWKFDLFATNGPRIPCYFVYIVARDQHAARAILRREMAAIPVRLHIGHAGQIAVSEPVPAEALSSFALGHDAFVTPVAR